MRPDLPEIVGDLVEDGVHPIVITNGVLLTSALLKRFPRGTLFQVTLLGPSPSLHDRLAGRRVFERVIHNAARIRKLGFKFTVVFVATRLNALAVYDTTVLAVALGAEGVMYNRVNLSSGMKSNAGDLVPSVSLLKESLHLLQEAVKKYGVPCVCSVPIPPCLVDPSGFPEIQFGWCPRGGDNAYYTVGPTGLLRPCNHSSVVLGDLTREGFAEIVSRKRCRDFWAAEPEECRGCNHPLRFVCRGGCPAAADEYWGTPYRRDPFCSLAGYGAKGREKEIQEGALGQAGMRKTRERL